MMSEAAWTAGHRAAMIPTGLAGLVMFLAGAANRALVLADEADVVEDGDVGQH